MAVVKCALLRPEAAELFAAGTEANGDADALLLQVEQMGGVACHTGRESCFYRVLDKGTWQADEPVITDPEQMYGKS